MSTRWEYKVAFVDGWRYTSVEGQVTGPEERERNSAFGRRFLNGFGVDGWELVGIQHVSRERAYYIFKRPIADGAEPDMSVVRREPAQQPAPNQQAPSQQSTPTSSSDVVSV